MAKQAVSKPNRNSLKGLWGGTMAKQAEGCAVLRLPKRNSLYLRWGGFPKETVCTSDGEVRWQSKRRVVRWQVLPVWRALKLRKAYNMPWQWQSRHEPCCTPTVIPGAAPPRPRLGRGRRISTATVQLTTVQAEVTVRGATAEKMARCAACMADVEDTLW